MGGLFLPICLSYVGLALFLCGFFLTRRELDLKASSKTTVPRIDNLIFHKDVAFTLTEVLEARSARPHIENPPPKKVFLFIVDALRLDFMTRQEGITDSDSPFNQFPNMHRLLEHNASQSLLFGFRADPPTVTAQRLKSLTTGSLPTFIDIGANMNSSAIIEDNFIDQLLSRAAFVDSNISRNTCPDTCTEINCNCTNTSSCPTNSTTPNPTPILIALGDDTWGSLFPSQFTSTHYYDSFNTRDLDTVDKGIISHLFDYLPCGNNLTSPLQTLKEDHLVQDVECSDANKPNWDLMIAHFLGVDHIGHTHNAFHPLMAERLALMDTLLLQVIERLPPNSVLFLFGDHGMTDQGEHGGSSQHETESGLFVYSTEPMFTQQTSDTNHNDTNGRSNENNPVESTTTETRTTGTCNTNSINTNNSIQTTTTLYWNDTTLAFEHTPLYNILTAPRVVPQIDFTPTISTLLGVPIPASSLGKVIPELFMNRKHNGDNSSSSNRCSEDCLLNTYFTNAMQIWRYLTTYWSNSANQVDHQFTMANLNTTTYASLSRDQLLHSLQLSNNTHSELVFLEKLLLSAVKAHLLYTQSSTTPNSTVTNSGSPGDEACLPEVYAKYGHFFTAVQDFTRNKWTQFKMVPMLMGLVLLVAALFLFIYKTCTVLQYPYDHQHANTTYSDRDGTTLSLHSIYTLASTAILYAVRIERSLLCVILMMGIAFHSLAALSDNFTKQEHWTVFGLVQVCTLTLATQVWCFPPTNKDDNGQSERNQKVKMLLLLTLSMEGLTLLWLFCPQSTHITQIAVICACVSVVVLWFVYFWCLCGFRADNHKQRFGWLDMIIWSNVTVSSACMIWYWAVKYELFLGSNTVSALLLGSTYLCTIDWLIVQPRTVLYLCTGNIAYLLCVLHISTIDISNNNNNNYYRNIMRKLVHVIVSFALILSLMLGPVGCICMVVCLVHTVVFVYCFSNVVDMVNMHADSNSTLTTSVTESVPVNSELILRSSSEKLNRLCMYGVYATYFPLMGRFLYFVTGHRMDFGTLQLWSGFTGSHTFNFYYAGLCLAINTFGAFVLYTLILYAGALYLAIATTSSSASKGKISNRTVCAVALVVHTIVYVSITHQYTIVCVSCIGAAILRRHLMVWAVFAPKMAFEACIWLGVSFVVLLVEITLPLS